MRTAYHQLSLQEIDRPYTEFEGDGKLYQFRRVPFGLTNASAAFQRAIDEILSRYKLSDVFAYLDDVVVCGMTIEEHDRNLRKFLEAAKACETT